MTVDEAFNYITDDNHCDSEIPDFRQKYCTYANDLYENANNKVQNKVIQDKAIQYLLIKARGVNCAHDIQAVCDAIDTRANLIQMQVVKEMGVTATSPIFSVGSAFIQGKFEMQQSNDERSQQATKLLKEATESINE